MNFLEERILKDGIVREGNVLKVDNFLNHQMDIELFDQMGAEFKDDESLPYWFFPGATVHVKANADLSSCTVTKAS